MRRATRSGSSSRAAWGTAAAALAQQGCSCGGLRPSLRRLGQHWLPARQRCLGSRWAPALHPLFYGRNCIPLQSLAFKRWLLGRSLRRLLLLLPLPPPPPCCPTRPSSRRPARPPRPPHQQGETRAQVAAVKAELQEARDCLGQSQAEIAGLKAGLKVAQREARSRALATLDKTKAEVGDAE